MDENEYKFSQEFTYIPNETLGEGFDIFIRAGVKSPISGFWEHAECHLATVFDEEQAKAFCDRLTKHFEDIYEIPRWCAKFFEIHGNMNGEAEILGI